jgi:hypothetical protein
MQSYLAAIFHFAVQSCFHEDIDALKTHRFAKEMR